jgi:outer membrane protein TolC
MRKISLMAAAACSLAVSSLFAAPAAIRLQDAVDAALAAGDDLRIAKGNLDAARAQGELARSKTGLSLSGSGAYSLADGFGGDLKSGTSSSSLSKILGSYGAAQSVQGGLSLSSGTLSTSSPYSRLSLTATQTIPAATSSAWTTLLGASLAQTIWDGYPGGQTKASLDKALLTLQGKELAAIQARSTVAAAAKRAYVTMLTAQRALALRAGVLEKQAALLRQIEATFALQQASAIDLMSARINERAAELDLETARHDLSVARQRLAILMGEAPDFEFEVAEIEEPALPAAGSDEAVAVGLSKRADAAQIELSRRMSAIDLTLAKAGSQPGWSATAGLNMGIVGGSSAGTAGSASLGLKLSLPLLDAGAADAQVAAVVAQLSVYEAQASQLSKAIATDIRDAYWAATILSDRIGLAKQTWDMNENQLALVKTQFQYGTATNQDLLTAQVNAANAGAAYLAAKGAYLLQELALETAMGL